MSASGHLPLGAGAADEAAAAMASNATDPIVWKTLSLTLVHYPNGDLFGFLLCLVTLAPLCIVGGFIPLILFRRDLHTITFFIGMLLNELSNKLLKHYIREERPLQRPEAYGEFGMPSAHAQCMWFFAVYVTLFALVRLNHRSLPNTVPLERTSRCFCVLVCFAAALAVCVSRVYLQYHTLAQVVVGALVGTLLGAGWFAVTQLGLTPLFPQVVQWRVAEFLMLRDTTLIPNILWFEYKNTRQEARARSRKLTRMKSQ